jgi:hypothetical protein
MQAEQRQERRILLALAAAYEFGDLILPKHDAPIVPVVHPDRVGAGSRGHAVPCDLYFHFGVILERDAKLRVAVRGRVRVRNRFFLVASAIFGDKVSDSSAFDAVFD